jgi:sugar phosphate isomerase/epimerase
LAAFEIEPPFVFNTEDHLRRILAGTDHPALKTIYDPSHFGLMNGSTGRPHEMLRRIGVGNIGYVHLTDTR